MKFCGMSLALNKYNWRLLGEVFDSGNLMAQADGDGEDDNSD